MPTLHLLGTGAALSDPHRTTTMLAFADERSVLLVDCGGDAVHRALAAGLDLDRIEALVVTHEHADHASGFPLLMEKLWLAGRRRPLPVCGIAPALSQARRCFKTFDTSGWEGLPELQWQETPHVHGAPAWESDSWRVTVTPVRHSKPNVGLRVEHVATGRAVAYSCDTEPVDAFVRLARGADVMVHEATGEGPGHSSIAQAAGVAEQAGVDRLLLVHLPPGLTEADLDGARDGVPGTALGEELGAYPF